MFVKRKPIGASGEFLEEPAAQFPPNHLLAKIRSLLLFSWLLSLPCKAVELDAIIQSHLAESFSREGAGYALSHQPYGTYIVRQGVGKFLVTLKSNDPGILHVSYPSLGDLRQALTRQPHIFKYPLLFDYLLNDAFVFGGRRVMSTAQATALLEREELGSFLIRRSSGYKNFYISVVQNRTPPQFDFDRTVGRTTKKVVYHLSFFEFAATLRMIKDNRLYFRTPFLGESIYDLDGIHQETGKDRFGFDRAGFNTEGFDFEGFDRLGFNRENVDRYGFRRDGFNAEGFNREGFDRAGYDREGYDREGFNRAGYNRAGRSREHLNAEAQDVQLPDELLEIDDYGYDPRGFGEQLPFAFQVDERFNKDGLNVWGFNFFGLERSDFSQWGFDAIVRNRYIPDQSGDHLLERFNRECFELVDPIEGSPLTNFDTLRTAISYQFAMDDERILGFLKKGLYVCSLLYGGGMPRNVDRDRPRWNFKQLNYKVNDLNYAEMLEALGREHPNFQYGSVIFNTLRREDILAAAPYIEESDNNLYRDDLAQKAEHIANTIEGYIRGRGVRQLEKGRYQLFKIALAIPLQSYDRLLAAAQLFLHGGAHCPDAKRDAIDAIFRGWIPQEPLQELRNRMIGTGFHAQLRALMKSLKEQHLANWINRKIDSEHLRNEQASFFAASWDTLAPHLGLDPIGSYTAMRLPLNPREFFLPNEGAFTPMVVAGEFASSPLYRSLVEAIFGPIFQFSAAIPANHPLPMSILTRFGYFMN